jgi:putative glycosyltransferase (TIGR04372 family)
VKDLVAKSSVRTRVRHFIENQTKQILTGGLLILCRKTCLLIAMMMAVPFILFVRALRPFILIRFGPLRSERIGHFALNTEVYLCERDASFCGLPALDIFYYDCYSPHHGSKISNQQLKKMWDRTLCTFSLAKPLDRLNSLLPGGKKHSIPWRSNPEMDIHGLLARTQPHIFFTPEEECKGEKNLRELGISGGASFVCFLARDTHYLNTMAPNINWRYHDYRNSKIHNYVFAAEELVRRGHFAIRMGSVVEEVLHTTTSMIIDYATSSRTDFLDIYLGAKCYFCLCDTIGFASVPTIFRRPLAIVNYIPIRLGDNWSSGTLVVPKKLWLSKDRRFMTFGECIALHRQAKNMNLETEQYHQSGIEIVENTPEEITGLAVEMDERLKETWQNTDEDEELQRRFWSLWGADELSRASVTYRIGAQFLRENRDLLDEG